MRGLDCNGGTKTTLKKFFFGFRSNSSVERHNSSNSRDSDPQQSSCGITKKNLSKEHELDFFSH